MIKLNNVCVKYQDKEVLKNINLEIKPQEFVCIIGLSGSGKTTLLKTILGLVKPSSGSCYLLNENINTIKRNHKKAILQQTNLIFQDYNLIPNTYVINNLLYLKIPQLNFLQKLLAIFPKQEKIKALTILDKMHLLDKAYEKTNNLSGGEQQRIAIARCIYQDPQIILADEPTSSLDIKNTQEILEAFKTLNQQYHKTILMNMHDLNLAKEYATRIIAIKNGRIVFDNSPQQLTKDIINIIYHKEQDGENNY